MVRKRTLPLSSNPLSFIGFPFKTGQQVKSKDYGTIYSPMLLVEEVHLTALKAMSVDRESLAQTNVMQQLSHLYV